MALTNPATVLPPTVVTSEVSISTGGGGTIIAVSGPCWYSFQAVSATAYVLFASTSTGMGTPTSASWAITPGVVQSFYLVGPNHVMKAMGSATGRLKKYRSGG